MWRLGIIYFRRWKFLEKNIRAIFVEPDQRSFLELKNSGLEIIDKALWSETTQKEFYLTKKLHTTSMYVPNRKYLDLFSFMVLLTIIFVIASPGASAAHLIVSEVFPNEIRS